MRVELLVIDPQNDFVQPNGALYVNGADADMTRLAAMVQRIGKKLDDIHVTLDSHHVVDVAHPIFWKDRNGNHPNPFTIISVDDLDQGVWTTTNPGHFRRMRDYVEALASGGRYPLCVWPEHCLIGSWGHNVYDKLFAALTAWERSEFGVVDYVTKGSNIFTEHYSAVKAEVVDPTDPTTQINFPLIQTLENADLIAVAGEAGSHCLANTVRDIAANFADPNAVKKIVLLTDATSPVTGALDFTLYQTQFIQDMVAKGMQLSTTTDFLK